MSFSDGSDSLDGRIISTGCRRRTRLSSSEREALSRKLSKITSPVVGWIACQTKMYTHLSSGYSHFQGLLQWLKLLTRKKTCGVKLYSPPTHSESGRYKNLNVLFSKPMTQQQPQNTNTALSWEVATIPYKCKCAFVLSSPSLFNF